MLENTLSKIVKGGTFTSGIEIKNADTERRLIQTSSGFSHNSIASANGRT